MGRAGDNAVGCPVRPGGKVGMRPSHGLRALVKGRRHQRTAPGANSVALTPTPPASVSPSGSSFLFLGHPFLSLLPTCIRSGVQRHHFNVCSLCLPAHVGHVSPTMILCKTWGSFHWKKKITLSCHRHPMEDRVFPATLSVGLAICYSSPSRPDPITFLDSSLDQIFLTAPCTCL